MKTSKRSGEKTTAGYPTKTRQRAEYTTGSSSSQYTLLLCSVDIDAVDGLQKYKQYP